MAGKAQLYSIHLDKFILMKQLYSLILGLFFTVSLLQAQEPGAMLTGMVTNEKEEVLIGASVYWKDTKKGAVTNENGRFSLPLRAKEATLVVDYVGYTSAEVQVLPGENNLWIVVEDNAQLKEVTVSAKGFDNHISTIETRNVERITSKELRKAPCCNLSESFQTNGAIDVAYPNALTGVKEIQLLGLRGIYSQFLVETRPAMTGIATPFAFEYIPGTWLSGIILAKGASTVKTGNNGITGQINADLVKPQSDNPVFVNVFTSTEGRAEMNLHLNKKGATTSNGFYLHGSLVDNKWDMNRDNFKDSPNRQQLNAMYRLIHDSSKGCAQFNIQALSDRRQSGQIRENAAGRLFEIDQQNDRLEAWGKYGKEALFGKRFLELGNIGSVSWHRTQSVFGKNLYTAEQKSLYWQTLLQNIIGTTDHKIVVAPSVQYDDIREKVNEGDLSRRETAVGIMSEYTYSRPNLKMDMPDFVLVLGGRVDWNSRFGWQLTPRMSAKYNFSQNSVVRVSAGRGFRSPNLMAENISLLASNRIFTFDPNIGVEEAWNYGVNYTQNFKIAKRDASFNLDLYRTDFVKQVLVDVEQAPLINGQDSTFFVAFYNNPGQSFSTSLLLNFQYNILPGLDIKFAYKWNDVRAEFADGKLKAQPLVARQRGLVSIDYVTPSRKWLFNTYVQIVGSQRLPDNSYIPHQYTHDFPANTPTFGVWNGQVTRKLNKKWELYAGCENITGYQQHHAIIAANEPDSPFFNGSQVWAPMMRQLGYLGVRFAPGGLQE
jgi:outer membrane receptor for ferrienterochelin and colicins